MMFVGDFHCLDVKDSAGVWFQDTTTENQAGVLTLIKAKTLQDPHVKNYCIVLEERSPLSSDGFTALLGCSSALDGSALTLIHS